MECSFVLPGDVIGSAEEFMSGEGTYTRGGCVYALTAGETQIDRRSKSVQVVPKTNAPPKLNVGDVVVGQIVNLKESLAIVCLAFKKGYESRPLSNMEAVIHISNISNSYVKDIHQAFSLRDIVKAKIIENHPSIALSTRDVDLGVIKSYCGRCTTALRLDKEQLICPNCGHVETRRLSTDYGLGMIR